MAIEWRDAAAYAPLLEADRSLFAWEWLRRDPDYRAAAAQARLKGDGARPNEMAAAFGLVRFEPPELSVPDARPLWRAEVHSAVLGVERGAGGKAHDLFALEPLRDVASLVSVGDVQHLLLSDGLRALRLDGPRGLFTTGPACLRFQLDGLLTAKRQIATLQRFLALYRTGRFARSLHSRNVRAPRLILMLRTWDAVRAGVAQREIALILFGREGHRSGWRTRDPSLRSQVQRLVHSARGFAHGGYRRLLG